MSDLWNEQFEESPANTDSPSEGPQEFEQTKTYFRERFANEHEFDLATPDAEDQGWHRSGSAKTYYQESTPTFRSDGATSLTSADNGRIWIRPSTGEQRVYEHPSWVPVVFRNAGENGVTLAGDYTIAGVKTFDDELNLPKAAPQIVLPQRSIWGNQYYAIRKQAAIHAVSSLTTRKEAVDNNWNSIAWSPELGLFAAVAWFGTNDRVMTSPDGITWTARSTPADEWVAIAWSPELGLFAAVANSDAGNSVMTSSDGINWTTRNTNNNNWRGITWSPELGIFAAVSWYGTNARVMTSSDGITWTARTTPGDDWIAIAWSPELGLFAAVSQEVGGNQVMTSPDGTNWTLRTTPADNNWKAIAWSPELGLFAAVASTGVDNRAMTSSDGINWTTRTPNNNSWRGITWSPELGIFVAVAWSNEVMTSHDGINWTNRNAAADNNWNSIAWSPELGIFAAVAQSGSNDRVMISGI